MQRARREETGTTFELDDFMIDYIHDLTIYLHVFTDFYDAKKDVFLEYEAPPWFPLE